MLRIASEGQKGADQTARRPQARTLGTSGCQSDWRRAIQIIENVSKA
jgi:hypothetical protein